MKPGNCIYCKIQPYCNAWKKAIIWLCPDFVDLDDKSEKMKEVLNR